MVRVNTLLAASLCALVLGGACTGPVWEEPDRSPSQVITTRRALGEGPASLMADLGRKEEGAWVRHPVVLGAAGTTLLFSATTDSNGVELWRVDPTGPALVKDIIPGTTGSSPSSFFHMRGLTYFTATDREHGTELWRTDGTAPGTFLLKDINPNPDLDKSNSLPTGFTEHNGWIFFSARDGERGTELWRTDGTPEGTLLVRDISLGAGSSDPTSFTELGGKLYFIATGPGGSRQLWRTDGTAAGTARVGSNVTVSASPSTRGLARVGRTLFFVGNDGAMGNELWKTDGTEAGTVRVKDIRPGPTDSAPVQLTAFGDAVYFIATDGETGREVWRSDGTAAGTRLLLELVPGNNTVGRPDVLVATSTHLFFLLRGDTQTESALYATDGTEAGTVKVVDFQSLGGKGPLQMMAHGSTLYFSGHEPTVGSELWTSDGTPTGTRRIGADLFPDNRSTSPGPSQLTGVGDTVYFVANAPGTGLSPEYPAIPTLWKTQGDAATTAPVGADAKPTRGSNPRPFVTWNGALYFTTFEQDAPGKLWRSDGTVGGTQALADVLPADIPFAASSGLSTLAPLNGHLYYAALSSPSGYQLWRTDGTPDGESLVASHVRLSNAAGLPIELAEHWGFLYFAGQDTAGDIELWKTDGSEAGTVLVKNIFTDTGVSSRPFRFTPVGDTLYFLVRDASGRRELWSTDGTDANTVRVTVPILDIAGVVGDKTLYFVAKEANTGPELWKTDGVGAPLLVKDIAPGEAGSGPTAFAVLDNILYFAADDGSSGSELWRSDGTGPGTWRVKDLSPGVGSARPAALTVLNGTLYFTAEDGTSGRELWKSDGTEEGTVRVADIFPGPESGLITGAPFALPYEKVLLFAANDGVNGLELWRSDGSEAGTFVLHDIAPWQLGSEPAGFTLFGDFLAFSADDGRRGREPWLMPRKLLTNVTPPSITCPADQVVEAQQALGARVSYPEAEANDDTSLPPALSYSRGPGSFFPFGETQVTATARDAAGLVATCTFTVTVRDTTPPVPVCPVDATVEATGENGAVVTFPAPVATDVVSRTPTVSVDRASGGVFPQGATLVTVTATDDAGNRNTCTFTIRVRDTTASVVTCPANPFIEAVDASGAEATWPHAEATDAASRPTIAYDPPRGSRFPLGSTTVTATATDGAGNLSSCTFQVIVRDTTAPTLKCPAAIQHEATGPAGAPAEFAVTNAVDTVASVTVSTSHASGATFPVGETPVRVRAEDSAGNVAECSFPVTVRDTLPPLLACPQDVSLTSSKTPVAVELPQASVTDRVTVSPSITMSPASGSLFQPGDTPVEVTATDAAGNTARCTFNVHVERTGGGCAAAPGSASTAGYLGLLSLLALVTRRRPPREESP